MKRFTSHFVEQKDIDSLKYEYDKVEEKPTPLLKGEEWKKISVPEPPRNSSPEARLELSMVKELGSNRSQKDINSIKEHDMVATYAIRDYLEENDLGRGDFEKLFYEYLKKGQSKGQLKECKDLRSLASFLYIIYNGLLVVSKIHTNKRELADSVNLALSLLS